MQIELRNVSKKFGRLHALEDVSLAFAPGQIVSIIGLNGAGKTTLLRCLGGIVAPSRGEVLYDGQHFSRDRLDLRRRLVYLPDFPVLYRRMTALQHLALMRKVYQHDSPPSDDELVAALGELDLLPLAEKPVAMLSRGQLYKVAFLGLLAVAPEVWLLDEPFASGLDPRGLAFIKARARLAAAAGATILYSTQILEIAEKFSDRLCVIDHGRLRADFSRADLDARPASGPGSLESVLNQFRELSS
jgi:ABC-type multidrug transport system ATPase subunit